MKKLKKHNKSLIHSWVYLLIFFGCLHVAMAQDSTIVAEKPQKAKLKAVRNTFDDNILIDNQTLQVPIRKTFEVMLQHRFGPVTSGYQNFYGLFSGANMSFRFFYSPINNLNLGIAFNEQNLIWEGNLKYALIKQSVTGGWPVSITFYGNAAVDTRKKEGNFLKEADRYSFFNQLMVGRKISEKISLQFSGSLSYLNNVPGYVESTGKISPLMNNAHLAFEVLTKYKISETFNLIVNYDQPITQHLYNNPHPSLALGIEINTKGHTFQLFGTNFGGTLPQYNNFFNQNDYTKGMWLVGFNLARRWHW